MPLPPHAIDEDGRCLRLSFAKSSSAWARRHPGSAGAGRWPGLRQGAGILTPPTRARTHRIRDGSRESGQATRGGLRTFSGTEGQKTEEAGLRGLAEVAVVQAADFGKLHDPPRRGKLDRPEVGCVLVEREMGTCLMIIGKGSRRRRSPDTLVVRAVPGGRAERRGRAWRG